MKSIKLILIVVSFFTSQIFAQDRATFTIANQNTSNTWSALGTGMNEGVWTLAVDGSDLYAGGQFINAGGVNAYRIAKWNSLTSTWSTLGSGMAGGSLSPMYLHFWSTGRISMQADNSPQPEARPQIILPNGTA